MRAPKIIPLLACHVLLLVLSSGCSRQKSAEAESTETIGVSFHAKHGLTVPATTAKFIGLEVIDVEERKVARALRFYAQVYRAAKETQFASLETQTGNALASGLISAQQAEMLHEGQTVTFETGGTSLPGRVARLNRGLEKASGQVEALFAIPDPQDQLTHGAQISIMVPLGGEKNVVSVPRSALLRTAEGDFVYTVSGDYFVRAPIKTGAINAEFVEVADGLYTGDRVVIKPVMTLWLAELQSIRGGKACADGH